MNREYWDQLAASYDEDIFSVLRSDRQGLIADSIAAAGGRGKTAADLGCGPGQITPLLASHFDQVHACDISSALLAQARRACAAHGRVNFHHLDLGDWEEPPFLPVDFVLCVNVLISADLKERESLWACMTSLVDTDGTLLLVVPSHESSLYTSYRRLDWQLRFDSLDEGAERERLAPAGGAEAREQGVREIDGVPTKHYLQEELVVQLADRSLRVESMTKLTYDWSVEFDNPPDWLGSPYPWNWLVVAKRD